MNKNVLIAIVVAVLLILLGTGAFFVLSNRTNTPLTSGTSEAQSTTPGDTEGKSIKDLMSMQGNQTCSFLDEAGNSGDIYVSGGKMRGDFVSEGPQGSVNSHMISDSQNIYIWMDGQAQGFKSSIDKVTADSAPSTQNGSGQVDVNKQVDFDCKGWSVNNTLFTLPEGVEFMDLSTIVTPQTDTAGTSGTPSTDTNAAQCAACDDLPSEAQASCRQALKCN